MNLMTVDDTEYLKKFFQFITAFLLYFVWLPVGLTMDQTPKQITRTLTLIKPQCPTVLTTHMQCGDESLGQRFSKLLSINEEYIIGKCNI